MFRVLRGLFFVLFVISSLPLRAELWPFDQRQVLLAQIQGTEFPNDLTTAQILDVFVERGRVRWITEKTGAGQLTPVLVPRDFQWSQTSSVRSLGLRYKADGVVVLSEHDSKVDLRWYSVSDGQPLYFESLYLPSSSGSPAQDAERRKRLRAWLSDMWNRIPGQGYVVKRDIENLQLEGAANEGLSIGDQISVLRLKNVKRHPVLKTLIGFDYSETGSGKILELAKPFSSAKVTYESDLDPIREGDRYLRKVPDLAPVIGEAKPLKNPEDGEEELSLNPFAGARIFDISPRLGVGGLKYEEKTADDLYSMSAFSISYGFRADLLVTRSWFAALQMDFGTGNFGSVPTDYGVSSVKSGWNNTRMETGYRMSVGDYSGGDTQITFRGGYSRFSVKAEETSSAVAPSKKTYSGIDVGVSVDVPVYKLWVAEVGFTRMLGAFLKEETLTSGSNSSNSAWSFSTRLRIKTEEAWEFGAGYEVLQGSSTFEGSGTRSTPALSAKVSSQRAMLFYRFMF